MSVSRAVSWWRTSGKQPTCIEQPHNLKAPDMTPDPWYETSDLAFFLAACFSRERDFIEQVHRSPAEASRELRERGSRYEVHGFSLRAKREEKPLEAERCVQETQRLLEEQLPTASQEAQNSWRISWKGCGRFAEAPRKGGPVFAGKCPRSTGDSMEPNPTQAAAKDY